MSSSCTPICAFKERFYTFRSDDAKSVSSDGSTFSVSFGNKDPSWADVRNVKISAVRATIWWTVPNLQQTSIYITFVIPSADSNTFIMNQIINVEVKIPKGLYGFGALNTLIDDALFAQNVPRGTFSLYADYATQKISLAFKWPGYVRFGSSELATVLGFLKPQQTAFAPTDAQRDQLVEDGEAVEWSGVNTQYSAPIPGWSSSGAFTKRIVAPYHARFDHVQYFNIQSNLADGGLYGNNGVAQNVIAQVLIDRLVGEQIVYDPNIPIELGTTAFSNGSWPTTGTFTLLDDKFRECDTNGQPWTITIRLQQVA